MSNKVTIRVRVVMEQVFAEVVVGGEVVATVDAPTVSEARAAAKQAAEEMGLVNL